MLIQGYISHVMIVYLNLVIVKTKGKTKGKQRVTLIKYQLGIVLLLEASQHQSLLIERLDSVAGVLPVDITQLVDGMNGFYKLSQIKLSHGLINLILVSV